MFIGPSHKTIGKLGDKIRSKLIAKEVGVPTIPGVEKPITSEKKLIEFAEHCGYPVMLKAAAGGGGRGMRVVNSEDKLVESFNSAKSEAKKAFGNDNILLKIFKEAQTHRGADIGRRIR